MKTSLFVLKDQKHSHAASLLTELHLPWYLKCRYFSGSLGSYSHDIIGVLFAGVAMAMNNRNSTVLLPSFSAKHYIFYDIEGSGSWSSGLQRLCALLIPCAPVCIIGLNITE